MSAEERSALASKAAEARWGQALPHETHGGVLRVGDIQCAVLNTGMRVITQRGLLRVMGAKTQALTNPGGGAPKLPPFLAHPSIYPYISADLLVHLANPIAFRPKHGGKPALGFEATLLPRICEVFLEARKDPDLKPHLREVADRAEMLVRGFATVGIIALVDEATGYQDERARDALAKILEKFLAKELRKWVRVFPPDFYKEMFRLRGWPYSPLSVARPGVVAHYTNDLVYDRLAPGVRKEILRVIPRNAEGRPKGHMHSMLSEDFGDPRLREHLAAVVALMKASRTWDSFMDLVDRALPRFGETRMLPMNLAGETNAVME